ncbi:hypothetical protein [Streptomyces sp. NBC_01216]|uniref:hypothetical protein n=1 Tax=unclassified Streptomyces TaxID=2593676 RepID=UPI002E105EB7|nr:hypothetical protein OG393_18935 [Streptomyces sp. NBC_01216]
MVDDLDRRLLDEREEAGVLGLLFLAPPRAFRAAAGDLAGVGCSFLELITPVCPLPYRAPSPVGYGCVPVPVIDGKEHHA